MKVEFVTWDFLLLSRLLTTLGVFSHSCGEDEKTNSERHCEN